MLRSRVHILASSCVLLAFVACGSSDADPAPGPGETPSRAPLVCEVEPEFEEVSMWNRFTVSGDEVGPAFVTAGDMNGDGLTDLVVSAFGAFHSNGDGTVNLGDGTVTIYLQGDSLNCWIKQPVLAAQDHVIFPNKTSAEDIDGDGDLDLFLPLGFFACQFDPDAGGKCGGLAWMENANGEWIRHDIVPVPDKLFFHGVAFLDFDGDGVKDVVTAGETSSSAKAMWFKGDASSDLRFDPTPRLIGDGLGSFPSVADIDGDGDLDIASAEYFARRPDGSKESFAWFEQLAAPDAANPGGTWERHTIDAQSGPSIHFAPVDNLYGDGVRHWLGSNHTNTTDGRPDPESAVFVFEVPADAKKHWKRTKISKGIKSRPIKGINFQAAPGVIGHGDIDGDGDIDVAVAGDGDPRTYWLEQVTPNSFETHIIEEDLGQASGAIVRDLNGDGRSELVFSGYEANRVFVYQRK